MSSVLDFIAHLLDIATETGSGGAGREDTSGDQEHRTEAEGGLTKYKWLGYFRDGFGEKYGIHSYFGIAPLEPIDLKLRNHLIISGYSNERHAVKHTG